jgi:hypothetical protein
MSRYQYTWTHYVFTCIGCHRLSKVAKERLDKLLADIRRTVGVEPRVATALRRMDVCISCVAGREIDGEHDVDGIVTVA